MSETVFDFIEHIRLQLPIAYENNTKLCEKINKVLKNINYVLRRINKPAVASVVKKYEQECISFSNILKYNNEIIYEDLIKSYRKMKNKYEDMVRVNTNGDHMIPKEQIRHAKIMNELKNMYSWQCHIEQRVNVINKNVNSLLCYLC